MPNNSGNNFRNFPLVLASLLVLLVLVIIGVVWLDNKLTPNKISVVKVSEITINMRAVDVAQGHMLTQEFCDLLKNRFRDSNFDDDDITILEIEVERVSGEEANSNETQPYIGIVRAKAIQRVRNTNVDVNELISRTQTDETTVVSFNTANLTPREYRKLLSTGRTLKPLFGARDTSLN